MRKLNNAAISLALVSVLLILSLQVRCEAAEPEEISVETLKDLMDAGVVATVIFSGIQGIATRWILEGMSIC